jgi:hypothetical protein
MSRLFALVLIASALLPDLLCCSLAHLVGYGTLASATWLLIRLSPRSAGRFVALAWGFLLPLVPLVGTTVIESGSLILLFFLVWCLPQARWFSWALPMLMYLGGTTLYEISVTFYGEKSYFSLVRLDDLGRLRDALRSFFSVQCPTWRYLAHVVLFIGSIDFFSASREFTGYWRRGFLRGAALSAAYAIIQWYGLIPFYLPNQTVFWTSIGRVSGLMTDPNALGVVMTLALWIVAHRYLSDERSCRDGTFVSLLFLGAGVVSGSRTFWLGSILLVVGLTYVRARRLVWMVVWAGVVAIVITTVLDLYTPLLATVRGSAALPEGVKRIISAMSLARFSETVASRSVFLALTSSIINRDPVFGVGANAFASYVPLVGASIPSLKGWIDNSNNFYLGIVAELGVLGLCAFVMTVLSRRRGDESLMAAGVVLVAVGLVLLTGPHTDFAEVLIPVALLIGVTTKPRRSVGYTRMYASGLFLIGGLIAGSRHERGVYGWHASDSVIRRWLSPDATIHVLCEEAGAYKERSLVIRPLYVPSREPLRVSIRASSFSEEIQFSDQSERAIPLPCGRYRLLVAPAWSPARAWPGRSEDRRLLGVEQIARP